MKCYYFVVVIIQFINFILFIIKLGSVRGLALAKQPCIVSGSTEKRSVSCLVVQQNDYYHVRWYSKAIRIMSGAMRGNMYHALRSLTKCVHYSGLNRKFLSRVLLVYTCKNKFALLTSWVVMYRKRLQAARP